MTLINKVLLGILFITTLVVTLFMYIQINAQNDILNRELKQRISLIKNNLESNAKNTLLSLKYNVENDIAILNFSHISALFQNQVDKKEIVAIFLINDNTRKAIFAGEKQLKELLPQEEHTTITITDINSDHFVVSAPINLHNKWGELHILYSLQKLQEEIAKAKAYQNDNIHSSVSKAILTSLFLAGFLLLLSYFFAKRMVTPIVLLTQTAQEIAAGNLQVSNTLKAIRSKDEIGKLATSFVDMSHKLDASYKALERKTLELQELNTSLEERVEEKVAQIHAQEEMMIAQSRLAAMGEMMSMIAHQWRQPLSTASLIITNAKIKAMLSGNESDDSIQILDNISDTITYLSNLIDNFQTYFKPDKLPRDIETDELIEQILKILQTRLTLEKVDLHLSHEESEHAIKTYANEVEQVLINIINNAIDAQKERRVKERHIWVTLNDDKTHLTITIEDNGGGISEDIIAKVFDPYFSTKEKNGTGLGLYMAKMIIEKHIGGRLSVHNTSNGAHFGIVIPKDVPTDD